MQQIGPGSSSIAVRLAQRLLNHHLRRTPGYRRLREDGAFGPRTAAAVTSFQHANHITLEHGVIGNMTWRALGLSVEIDHTVILRAQHYDMGCWSASAAMMLDRDMSIGPNGARLTPDEEFALEADIDNVTTFVRPFGWHVVSPPSGVRGLVQTLAGTPIWIGGGVVAEDGRRGGHVVVISGAWGDGTDYGTFIRIHDPWPVNRGAITTCSYPYMTAMGGLTFDPMMIAGPF